jgi:hypothetical protein
MPTNYKILGQIAATANTTHNVYTVPAATQAVVSTVVICNRGGANTTYRIACQPAGAALTNTHFIAFDSAIALNDSIALTLGITLGNTDILSVNAATSDVTFTLFGSEIT